MCPRLALVAMVTKIWDSTANNRILVRSMAKRRVCGRPPTNWIHQIYHDMGVTATDALQLVEDNHSGR